MATFPVRDGYPSFISDHTNKKPSQHLYVGNLSSKVEEHELLHLFSQYGEIESIGFLKRAKYSFISYTTVEAAIMAVRQLNNFPLHGLPLDIQFKKPSAASGITAGNLGVGYSNGPKRMPPSERSSQDVTGNAVSMDRTKRMRYDSIPENPESGRLDIASFSKPAELDCSKEYKWEGIVAKGGVSICSARCFSVQRTIDIVWPQFLNFTSKLDLKILRSHRNQVDANAGVVCFEPDCGKDARSFCKFVDYLYKQKKAAVAKLNENYDLIVVPPSNISESVLNAPQRFSLVGFINKLKQPNLYTGIAENDVVWTHMGPKELQGEMIPSQSKPIPVESISEARYQATLKFAAEFIQAYCGHG